MVSLTRFATRGFLAAALSGLLAHGVAAEEIIFKDQENREVKLAKAAERIVSIVIPMASTVIALDGGTKKLVGMNPTAKSAVLEGILSKIFPETKDIPSDVTAPNFVPNIEALTATNPDLVIQWGGRGNDIVAPITNAGLNAMLILYGTEQLTRDYMTMTSRAISKPERIKELVEWRDRVQKDIEAKAKAIPQDKKPSTLYIARALSEIATTGTKGSYNAWYMELVGGRNASAELNGTVTINKEQIAQWDPEIIFLNAFEAKLDVNWVYNDPILSLTKAARNKRVYKMPLGGYRWDPPNQESPLAWMWTANLTQPDVFKYDLRAEMKTAYKALYNYDITDADIDSILWMKEQSGSANYAQFKAK
ncbi:ABC transporter substrate-binding protein [Neorhizobium galegae]|uniref:ABC transporter substrate-binding protein n=1 Tax=Neorhizobium galegae TaxID=399 RepID=UPI0006226272|nr:ABC transporter substrate-binding protein [Neorhizobium galegae]CDZ30530.1 Putative ABC-transport protein, periplasmic-binding component [Neorhizobium galegae bv. officinalis]KAA9385356.1 ABC transporter substrate-binding protein [Neorhizobium galegae]KAB1113175.1 ABC transporter substrate-binding protein [Neorhizobium galegae]MCM2499433.1 ABC transporter substrate-binding protein [Neorhizobium galegae]MCQ1774000.1 ABC transporter substrate-binding protein [Neorhizobium galegae]